MFSNSVISKVLNVGRLFIPQNYFYIPLAGVKIKGTIELPEKPKKPLSSFFRFMQEHKAVLKREQPDLKLTALVSKCAEDWRNIHPTIKERYDNEFKAEMEVYIKKHLDYSMKLSEEQKEYIKLLNKEKSKATEMKRNRKKLKSLNKPKRPLNAFFLFAMDQPKIEGQKLAEFMKSLKGQWSLLNESEKLMYRQKADDLQEKYKEELDKWESQMIQEGNTEFVRRNILKKKLSDPNKKKSVSKTKSTESPSTDGKETKNE